jgi:hypothetical protein
VRRTQILLSEEFHDALRARSFTERTSLGEQVRRAVEEYLGRATPPSAPRRRRPPKSAGLARPVQNPTDSPGRSKRR